MDTLTIVVFALNLFGAVLGAIFQAYRLYREVRKNKQEKSEPSVSISVAHLGGMEIDMHIDISIR